MKLWRADLHIHTCLSPCAEWEMTPRAIVKRARTLGLDLIAICDHNSGENAEAAVEVGQREGLAVVRGIEITTEEEVHILGLFDRPRNLEAVQEHVYAYLAGENAPDVFGYQVVVDANDEVVGENPRLLIGATRLAIEEAVGLIQAHEGVAIAAHIDREGFGLIGHLGFVPDVPLDGLEVSPLMTVEDAKERFGLGGRLGLIRASDAHRLEEIGCASALLSLVEPTAAEIRLALQGRDGRAVRIA
ncbi:MAG: PHP domain-containing protein [Candidatus Sumerlaeia bacterium]|nr:PHP domain-containing protein [Candidatus Sumerlaeia bacterium]